MGRLSLHLRYDVRIGQSGFFHLSSALLLLLLARLRLARSRAVSQFAVKLRFFFQLEADENLLVFPSPPFTYAPKSLRTAAASSAESC